MWWAMEDFALHCLDLLEASNVLGIGIAVDDAGVLVFSSKLVGRGRLLLFREKIGASHPGKNAASIMRMASLFPRTDQMLLCSRFSSFKIKPTGLIIKS